MPSSSTEGRESRPRVPISCRPRPADRPPRARCRRRPIPGRRGVRSRSGRSQLRPAQATGSGRRRPAPAPAAGSSSPPAMSSRVRSTLVTGIPASTVSIVRAQTACLVKADAGSCGVPARIALTSTSARSAQVPELRGASVGEDRTRPAGEHCRHPPASLDRSARDPDAKTPRWSGTRCPLVEAVARSAPCRSRARSSCRPRDDSVLPLRELPDRPRRLIEAQPIRLPMRCIEVCLRCANLMRMCGGGHRRSFVAAARRAGGAPNVTS